MIDFAERAIEHTASLDRDGFVTDRLRYDATLRNLELIGEAATRVPESVRLQATAVPWRQVVAVQNRLGHAYLGIDDDVVWNIVENDLAPLIESLRELQAG